MGRASMACLAIGSTNCSRRSGSPQSLRQVGPERVEPGVGHLEDPTEVGGAGLVEEDGGRIRVAVDGVLAVALAVEQPEGDEGVGEVGDRASVAGISRSRLPARVRFAYDSIDERFSRHLSDAGSRDRPGSRSRKFRVAP